MNTWDDLLPDADVEFHSIQPAEYGESGWLFTLHVTDADQLRTLLERWGPR
jgi:hypothetical protein